MSNAGVPIRHPGLPGGLHSSIEKTRRQILTYIVERTGKGYELVDIMLSLARNCDALGVPGAGNVPPHVRAAVTIHLLDRIIGKAPQTIDVQGAAPGVVIDVQQFSSPKLHEIQGFLEAAIAENTK